MPPPPPWRSAIPPWRSAIPPLEICYTPLGDLLYPPWRSAIPPLEICYTPLGDLLYPLGDLLYPPWRSAIPPLEICCLPKPSLASRRPYSRLHFFIMTVTRSARMCDVIIKNGGENRVCATRDYPKPVSQHTLRVPERQDLFCYNFEKLFQGHSHQSLNPLELYIALLPTV